MINRRDWLKGAAAGAWLIGTSRVGAQAPRPAPAPGALLEHLVQYVDPFIGTGGDGRTYPGATLPSGMVQLGPDSGREGAGWTAGYHYSDTHIAGFSHTHLSGSSFGELCDISVMPVLAGRQMPERVASAFTHEREKASPGSYAVDLLADEIKVELTVTRRVGIHRYRFPRWIPARPPAVVLDLGFGINGDRTVDAGLSLDGPTTVTGYRFSSGRVPDQRVFFAVRFSKAVNQWLLGAEGDYSPERRQATGPRLRALFRPVLRPGDPLILKVGLSPVSAEAALRNLETEAPGWDVDAFRRDAEDAWERKLQRVVVEARDSTRKTIFYTGLYHALLAPTLACDADRSYRGADGRTATAAFQQHTAYALGDTFRALHPLLTLVQGERVDTLVQSLMAGYRERGQLPVWPLWSNDANAGVGNHAAPVLVDAILKNLTTVDRGEALDALKQAAQGPGRGLAWLSGADPKGYIPSDSGPASVSKTLEYAFDDWCVSRLAAKLERASDRRLFEARAAFYRNLYDASSGLMRPRLGTGAWHSPFVPDAVSGDDGAYAGGTAWQHTWSVMHDVRGLMQLAGGAGPFVKQLDTFFGGAPDGRGGIPRSGPGAVGRYDHALFANQHAPYLYAYAGAPWRASVRVRDIAVSAYGTGPDGLCGPDSGGQLSAWYVLSALGFYPVNPVGGVYVFGAPLVDRAVLDLGGGTTFTVESDARSDEQRVVTGASLNGKPLDRCWIGHDEIVAGGTLRFTMGTEPNRSWASAAEAAPPSMTPL